MNGPDHEIKREFRSQSLDLFLYSLIIIDLEATEQIQAQTVIYFAGLLNIFYIFFYNRIGESYSIAVISPKAIDLRPSRIGIKVGSESDGTKTDLQRPVAILLDIAFSIDGIIGMDMEIGEISHERKGLNSRS